MTHPETDPLTICPSCGRRSLMSSNICTRRCETPKKGLSDEFEFLALCERHKVRMINLSIYNRRSKNTLKTAAISLNKIRANKDESKRDQLIKRYNRYTDHIALLDDIWRLLNPTKQYDRGWNGIHGEIVTAARCLRDGSFDERYANWYIN